MNVGVILSGGEGARFGGGLPKQYHMLCGKKIIEYSLQAFESSKLMERYLIMTADTYYRRPPFELTDHATVLRGGNSRNASIKASLDYIQENIPGCQNVFIQEAARPFLTGAVIDDYLQKLDEYDAVITAKKITDSIGSTHQWYVNRDDYYLIQAPEAFRYKLLYQHFKADSPITATVQQLPEGVRVYRNYSFLNNFKITYSGDLLLAENILNAEKKANG